MQLARRHAPGLGLQGAQPLRRQARRGAAGGERVQGADFPAQGPQHHRRFHAFGAQGAQNAQRPVGVAAAGGVGEVERRVAAGIAHRLLHGGGVDAAVRGQQGELVHFLGGGQQVAFAALDQQFQGVVVDGQLEPGEPVAQPVLQLLAFHRPDLHYGADLFHRLDPGAVPVLAAVQPRAADQNQGVVVGVVEQIAQDLAAGFVRALFQQHQFQNPAAAEQAHALRFIEQGVPVDAGVGAETVALVEAFLAGAGAQGIQAFVLLQGLVAGHQIDRQQVVLQVLGELLHTQAHGG